MSTYLSQEQVSKLQEHLPKQSLSLESEISNEDDRRFVELLQDPSAPSPSKHIIDQELFEHVLKIIGNLSSIEADILHKRFGLTGEKEHTLGEIGLDYQLSRERIRQIQEQALEKIRRSLRFQKAM